MNIQYWSLDCDIIAGPREAGVKIAEAGTPAIAADLVKQLNHLQGGVAIIAFERGRHLSKGWTPEHDDEHDAMEIASAAACYLDHYIYGCNPGDALYCARWPWTQESWKPAVGEGLLSRIENLAVAGSLIAAEIDRLKRQGVDAASITMDADASPETKAALVEMVKCAKKHDWSLGPPDPPKPDRPRERG